jgi:hypothetical protein
LRVPLKSVFKGLLSTTSPFPSTGLNQLNSRSLHL